MIPLVESIISGSGPWWDGGKTGMRRAEVSEDPQRRMVGHGKPDVHARYGGRGLLPAMAEAVASVDPLQG
jgi:hypothetical protein